MTPSKHSSLTKKDPCNNLYYNTPDTITNYLNGFLPQLQRTLQKDVIQDQSNNANPKKLHHVPKIQYFDTTEEI